MPGPGKINKKDRKKKKKTQCANIRICVTSSNNHVLFCQQHASGLWSLLTTRARLPILNPASVFFYWGFYLPSHSVKEAIRCPPHVQLIDMLTNKFRQITAQWIGPHPRARPICLPLLYPSHKWPRKKERKKGVYRRSDDETPEALFRRAAEKPEMKNAPSRPSTVVGLRVRW
jgi:hypothetical protein